MKFKFLPVYPSDVQNSFTETHAIDVCPTPAVIATQRILLFFAFAHDAMIANSPTSSSSHDTDTVRCCYNL